MRLNPAAGGALRAIYVACIFGAMTYIIADPCITTKDASCVDVCPVDCIYEAEDQYYIHPEECIDCGACVPECPVEAIFPDDEVPEEWQEYIAKNYEHFQVPPP
jgi:NAD-dependent dihydropyrimidine dehydrogenase PreA subunit